MSDFVIVRSAADGSSAVRHPEHGGYVVLMPADKFPANDPLVRKYPWLFATEDAPKRASVDAPIETATRAPGEQRNTKRTSK